jgi:hypothetical protein
MEVLLIDCAAAAPMPLAGSDEARVRVLRLPAGTPFSAAKAAGIRAARGGIVAFLEEHCRVAPGWAAALVAAHRGPWAAVGAEVHNGNPGSWVSRVVAVMNYHPWLAPAVRGEHSMLPGHNASFRRELLLAYGDELPRMLRAEIALHSRLRRDGHRLGLEPAARFAHINESDVGSMVRGYFLFHRCYGPTRAEALGWTAPRRGLYALAASLVPIYFVARLLAVLTRRRPGLLSVALAGLPWILVAQAASAAGQAAGLLFGVGDAEARFTDFELNADRDPGRPTGVEWIDRYAVDPRPAPARPAREAAAR